MPKRATQVCNEMLSGRNFLRAAEIALNRKLLKSIICIGLLCFAGKEVFLYTV
jgi:hypothetical protein